MRRERSKDCLSTGVVHDPSARHACLNDALGWFVLVILPIWVLGLALWLTAWWTSALDRRIAWPWFAFAFICIALGAVMYWLASLALLGAIGLLAIGIVQFRHHREVPAGGRA